MSYEYFIARRYLFSREAGPLALIITLISILGVAIGVCALIVVISVMDGADEDLFRRMIDVLAHVRLSNDSGEGIRDYAKACDGLDATPGVVKSAPAIMRYAAIYQSVNERTDIQGIFIVGIDPEKELQVTAINQPRYIKAGKGIPGNKEIVLGAPLARRLHINLGDEIRLITKLARTANNYQPKIAVLRVVGLLESGYYEFDSQAAYVSLPTAQDMYVLDDVADEIRVRMSDPFRVEDFQEGIKDTIRGELPEQAGSMRLLTWIDQNGDFFKALKLEKLALFIILMLVILVAAFNIVGTQILVVMLKTREIGILMSMGVSRRSIRRIFLSFGTSIGALGTFAGLIAGIAICMVIAHTNLIRLPEEVYGLSRLPVKVSLFTVSVTVFSSMFICMSAAVFPAWRAARLDPVEALRYE